MLSDRKIRARCTCLSCGSASLYIRATFIPQLWMPSTWSGFFIDNVSRPNKKKRKARPLWDINFQIYCTCVSCRNGLRKIVSVFHRPFLQTAGMTPSAGNTQILLTPSLHKITAITLNTSRTRDDAAQTTSEEMFQVWRKEMRHHNHAIYLLHESHMLRLLRNLFSR